MRAKHGSRLLLLVAAALLFGPVEARADFAQCSNPLTACTATQNGCCYTTFPTTTASPILIPTDRCHQPVGTSALAPPVQSHVSSTVATGGTAPRREFTILSYTVSGTTITATLAPVVTGVTVPGNGDLIRIAGAAASLNTNWTLSNCGGCAANQVRFTGPSGLSDCVSGCGRALSFNKGNAWCGDYPGSDATRVGGSTADDGMFKSYGLIYRLMQSGIPVYWLVNPSKSVPALSPDQSLANQTYLASDVDFWVLTSDLTTPPTAGEDLTICNGGACATQPVHRLDPTTLTPKNDSYRFKQFAVRGGAFLIAPADRVKFDAFWLRNAAPYNAAPYTATKYAWTTSGIDLWQIDSTAKIVYQDFTTGDGTTVSPYGTTTGAPVAVKIDYEPPRVACYGCNNAVAEGWLDKVGLFDPASAASCLSGEFSPSDATYCLLDASDISAGGLVSGGFSWLWLFGLGDNSPCADSGEKAVFDKISDFLTTVPAIRNAGHVIALDSSVKIAEGCANKQLLGIKNSTTNGLDLSTAKPGGGSGEPMIIRYPANLIMQYGDVPTGLASGSIAGWNYYKSGSPTVGYQTIFNAVGSSLRRLLSYDTSGTGNTICTQHISATGCDVYSQSSAADIFDFAAYARYGDVGANGLAFYLPGNQLDTSGNLAELRILMNTLLALPDESYNTTPTSTEVSRSSPVVATVDGEIAMYTGTYERLSPIPSIPKATTTGGLSRFTFPYLIGHMRAIPTSSFTACSGTTCATSNSARTAISGLSGVIFDAADHIPAATAGGCTTSFNGSCRTIFTTTASGRLPTRVMFSTANVSTLGPIIASNLTTTEQNTLIGRILSGYPDPANPGSYIPKLGGVDHSTPAVIGPSPLAGSSGRPTMVYFGAMDGMMHAVCASVGGGCDVVGRELWAYIPRTELTFLRQSIARVDGSPHVIDAYGDFDNTGTSRWATILIFATGNGDMSNLRQVPAVYAIDVTTPNNPKVLWEYSVTNLAPYDASTNPTGRSTYAMGVGLNIVAGTATNNETYAWVQTTNGGIGGPASVVTAINVVTGALAWQVGDVYAVQGSGEQTSGRSTVHEPAPGSAIPGGVVPLDTTSSSRIDKIVYGTIYGEVFVRSAADGTNQQTGATPLLRLSTDYHPLGGPPAIFKRGTGTYAAFATGGYIDSQSTLWRGSNEATVPTQYVFAVNIGYTGTTTTENDATNVPIKLDFASSADGGFAQPIVVGNELFVVTDSTNINSYDYGTNASPTGKVYRLDVTATSPAFGTTMVIAGGAGSLFNDGTKLMSSSGQYGEATSAAAASTTGTAVDPISASVSTLLRRLWLRTE